MKYNTEKHKISKVYENTQANKNTLKKVKNLLDNKYINTYSHVTPKLLYDSKWIVPNVETATTPREYLIQNEEPENEAYIWLYLAQGKTAMKGQKVAFPLDVWFSKELEIPESLLPAVDYTLLISKTPDFDIFPHAGKSYNVPVTPTHYKLTSNGTLIYQGDDIYGNPFPLDEYNIETFPESDYLSLHYKGQFGSLTYARTIQYASAYVNITDLGMKWIRKPGFTNIFFYQRIANYTHHGVNLGFKSITGTTVLAYSSEVVVTWYDTGTTTSSGAPVYDVNYVNNGYDMRGFSVTDTGLESVAITDPISKDEDLYLISSFSTLYGDVNASPGISWISLEHVGYYLFYSKQLVSPYYVKKGFSGAVLRDVPHGTTAVLIQNDSMPTPVIPDNLIQADSELGTIKSGKNKQMVFSRVYQENKKTGEISPVKGKYRIWTYDKYYLYAQATENVKANYTYKYDEYEWYGEESHSEETREMPYYAPIPEIKVRLVVTINSQLYYQEIKKFNKKENINGL